MSTTAPNQAVGPGSVSGAPNLPQGFTDTFTSQYDDAGDVRLHTVLAPYRDGGGTTDGKDA